MMSFIGHWTERPNYDVIKLINYLAGDLWDNIRGKHWLRIFSTTDRSQEYSFTFSGINFIDLVLHLVPNPSAIHHLHLLLKKGSSFIIPHIAGLFSWHHSLATCPSHYWVEYTSTPFLWYFYPLGNTIYTIEEVWKRGVRLKSFFRSLPPLLRQLSQCRFLNPQGTWSCQLPTLVSGV